MNGNHFWSMDQITVHWVIVIALATDVRTFIIVSTAETYDAPVPKSVVGMLKVFLGTHPTEVNSNFVPSNASYPANHFTFPITWTWTGISYWKSFRYLSPFGKWDGGYFPVHCIAWVSGKAHSIEMGV